MTPPRAHVYLTADDWIGLSVGEGELLTPDQARSLAAHLTAIADRVDDVLSAKDALQQARAAATREQGEQRTRRESRDVVEPEGWAEAPEPRS